MGRPGANEGASHVDVGWAIGIACLAVVCATLADGGTAHRVLAAVLASVWAWRLGLYLLVDRVLGKEDGRYRALGAKWGSRADHNFFLFFQFQALFVVFFSVPYLLITSTRCPASARSNGPARSSGRPGTPAPSRPIGNSRAGGPTPRTAAAPRVPGYGPGRGHPDYFLEWITWCGVALAATAAPWGWAAWAVPVVLLFLLVRVTGIPATEAQALRTRADDADYRRTTSVFVPLPPRTRGGPA